METILLEKLLSSPKLKLYLEEIQQILSGEQEKRVEFYKKINEDDKAEFINGEIIFHTPVPLSHNTSVKLLAKLLDTFVGLNDLGYVGLEKILISLTRNDYEPDICFFRKDKSKHFKARQVQFPAPDFIAEVLSPATEQNDRGVKFEDYAAHGISEYWIVDTDRKTIEQYILKNDEYELSTKSGSGMIKSNAIPGFEIPIAAVFNPAENLKSLKNMLK